MAKKTHTLHKLGLTLWMATAVVMPNVSSAAPGTLASVPLFTQANADPNIMFILDSSISMQQSLGGNSRFLTATSTLSDLIDSLSNVRVGLAKFDSDVGADIVHKIDDIATSGPLITGTLSGYTDSNADSSTPLAEALRDVGRYFSNDASGNCAGGQSLQPHPGDSPLPPAENCNSGPNAILSNRFNGASWDGPTQYHCQSNFVVYLTDGLARGDQNIHSTLADYDGDCQAANIPDSDGDGNPDYNCNAGHDRKSNQTYDAADVETSDYVDDVAQALYEMDLRPDLDDDGGNEVTNNVRTFVIAFAESGISSSQLLQDTASQGGGTFSFAADGADLASDFQAATSSILNLIGSAAAVTFNSATLGTNSAVYLALFNSSSWSGDLVAYDLNDNTGAIEGQTWRASTNLDAMTNTQAVANRVMLTFNGNRGIPFRWPTNYTSPTATEMASDQINDLITNAPTGQEQGFGARVVAYLRGDDSMEGTTFRNRTSRLGDIVHAGPIFVGPPELNWPDGTGAVGNHWPDSTEAYSIYKNNTSTETNAGRADRPGVVYVGSNDGFLHGFATDDVSGLWSAGEEVLAYAPRALFSTDSFRGYHYLADPNYNHQYYVDLLPTVSDYFDANAGTNGEWKTILVGGLRGGGRGIYALNVTDPANFSEANASNIVMGEFTNNDDADLGYTFSSSTIALMENGRWAIVMGNGYNPDTTITDAQGNTATGEASLFIIYLDPDLTDGTWDLGTDYEKITTGVGTTANLNGLSTPSVVDLDGDGYADRAYAGDLMGNMWAFDLSASNGNWDIAYTQGPNNYPLFTATSPDGDIQPITVQPEIAYNPDGTGSPNVMVLFGTGQYMASGDNANLGKQAFYSIWDDGTHSLAVDHADASQSDLVEQELSEASGQRTISSNTAVDYTTKHGWYINFDLNSDGERIVTNPIIRGDYVYFNTSIPTSTTCSYGGTGWQMAVQFSNGHNPSPAITDTDGDNDVDGDDAALSGVEFEQGLPAAPSFLSNRRYTPGTRTQSGSEVVDDAVEDISGLGTGRLSWEELEQ